MAEYHIPVLLKPSVDLLGMKPEGVYVDATFGGGGHSREMLSRLTTGKLIAFDQDPDARKNVQHQENLVFIPKNFAFLEQELAMRGWKQVDGILADLGISSHQIDTPGRGFSYRFDAPLDMRMNPGAGLSAQDLLNEAPPQELVTMFRRYGEVPNAVKLAGVIADRRRTERIETTFQLESMISSCIPMKTRAKYLAQVYQALRIVVNGEMEVLEKFLLASLNVLAPGGRIAVIAYHSLEDRMVKHFFRAGNFEDRLEKDFYGNSLSPWKLITRRPVSASETEIEQNPRARSARLRVAEKI
jgi:16S rRNA (cytosine1402-N4)-methyltransferase